MDALANSDHAQKSFQNSRCGTRAPVSCEMVVDFGSRSKHGRANMV